jgi:hypothetical protein
VEANERFGRLGRLGMEVVERPGRVWLGRSGSVSMVDQGLARSGAEGAKRRGMAGMARFVSVKLGRDWQGGVRQVWWVTTETGLDGGEWQVRWHKA